MRFEFLQFETMRSQIVLITGGAGFLGQHVVKVLQETSSNVEEIRIIDVKEYRNKLGHAERIPVKPCRCDITTSSEQMKSIFDGVETVFHCAAFVSYEFPPNRRQLFKDNVKGTQNILALCREAGVKKLVYTSSAEVSMRPYFRNGFFAIMVNETERKARPSTDENQILFGSYAASKLKAEELVLAANGIDFKTVALRPPIMYGEEDEKGLLPFFMKLASVCEDKLWRLYGQGGKLQYTYAGNVAWAHVCAMNTLDAPDETISGLPVFITDDTSINDHLALSQKLVHRRATLTRWFVPLLLSFLIALIFETAYGLLSALVGPLRRIPIRPTSLVTYMGSVIFFNRLRAAIRLGYEPLYDENESMKRSRGYYLKLLSTNIKK